MAEPKKDVLQPLDQNARRLAKGLVRSARHAALATIAPGTDGFPAASRVLVATDAIGQPVILISQLSAHFRALEADPRCSLLLGEPGKGDPLAHPRISVSGVAHKLVADDARDQARARFLARHPKSALYADFGDFAFWLIEPLRIALNGGFAKAYEASGADILADVAVGRALAEAAPGAVDHMNRDHGDAIDRYAAMSGAEETGWRLTTIDPEGLDLARGDQLIRVWFPAPLKTAAELRATLVAMATPA